MRDCPWEVVLTGAALLARAALLRRIGGFDEAMFAYWEDVDLSVRSSLAGARNVLCPEARAYHFTRNFGRVDSVAKPHCYYYTARNESAFLRKHGSGRLVARAMYWAFLRQMLLLERMAGNRIVEDAILAGIWHGWAGRAEAYDSGFRMPWPLRELLRRHPGRVRRLLERGRGG
jgi:GT2 family glycosyltransferase